MQADLILANGRILTMEPVQLRAEAVAVAPICFASDWPAANVRVMRGLQAALTRQPFDDSCGDERLSREESLYAYTAGGAWAVHL